MAARDHLVRDGLLAILIVAIGGTLWAALDDFLLAVLIAATLAASIVLIFGIRMVAGSLGDFGNGVLGFATMIALLSAAWLYYFEGRGRPRVEVSARATVVAIPGRKSRHRNARLEHVLIQFSVRIENHSERSQWFECGAIDLMGIRGAEPRSELYADDLQTNSLLDNAAQSPLFSRCQGFEDRRRREAEKEATEEQLTNPPLSGKTPTSGRRYRAFFMEPGEITTKTWEQIVSCDYNAVRAVFKLPKPQSTHDYEAKIVIPIVDVCRRGRLVAEYPTQTG